MNKNNIRHPNRRAVEKTAAEIEAHYVKQAKNYMPFLQQVKIPIHSLVPASPTI